MEKVRVNEDLCIGCGACTAIAGEVFSFNEKGFVHTNEEKNTIESMDEDLKNDVMDALSGCPTSAIYKEKIEEE